MEEIIKTIPKTADFFGHKVKLAHFRKHETKKFQLKRFLMALAILILYTGYLYFHFGASGITLGLITWSAFVMATPVADGGLILDLPIRVFTGIRMVYSEMIVWTVAISMNIYLISSQPETYNKTVITHAFGQILRNPWPDWIIIFISLLGTFLSLYFGDELLDVVFHKDRKKYLKHRKWLRFVWAFFGFAVFYVSYKYFLELFGLKI